MECTTQRRLIRGQGTDLEMRLPSGYRGLDTVLTGEAEAEPA